MRGSIPVEAKDFSPVQRWQNNEHRHLPMAKKTFAHLLKMGTLSIVSELVEQSIALERAGEIGAALQRAQVALEQAQAIGDAELVVTARNRVASVYFRLGHYDAARALAQQSLVDTVHDSCARAEALLILGNCAAETNSLTEAESCYHRAADLSRTLGCHRIRTRALHGLGQGVYLPRGQFDLALAVEEEAYHVACQQNLTEWTPYPLTALAWIYQITGQFQRAHHTLDTLSQVILPGSLHQGYHDYLAANLALDEGAEARAPTLYARAFHRRNDWRTRLEH